MSVNITDSKTDMSVHNFDGKLSDLYQSLVIIDDNYLKTELTYDQTLNEIIENSNNITNKIIQKIILNVINKIKSSSSNNFDTSNNVHFEDLIVRLWKFYRLVPNQDKAVFYEQLFDMRTGLCPQGRSGARLIQLYTSWIDALQDYNKNIVKDKDILNVFTLLKK